MSDTTQAPTYPENANMMDIEIKVNGVGGIKYQQPADVATYDLLAKRENACRDAANKQQLFHGSYGDIRAAVTGKLVAAGHGTPKLFIGKVEVVEVKDAEDKVTGYENVSGAHKSFKADADVKVEPDKAFFDRVCAEKGVDATYFKDLIQDAANENPFDPSRKERASGPRKIAKTYLETAAAIIEAGAHEGVASSLEELLERTIDVSDPETRLQVLAAAISDNEARERKERDAQAKSKYLALVG
jgi:hypothetical protein